MSHSPRFLKLCDEIRPTIVEVTADDVAARMARHEALTLIDVREESEVAMGRIRGAKHVGKGVIERDIEKVCEDPGLEIILYCGGGFRSAIAAETLMRMGYTNVKSMAGGWREWTSKEYPTEA